MNNDFSALQPHRHTLTVPLMDGSKHKFVFALNLPTGIYYQIVANVCAMMETADEKEQAELCIESAALLLGTTGKDYDIAWVRENVTPEIQLKLIDTILGEISNILRGDLYEIPDIKISNKSKKKPDKNDKKAKAEAEKKKYLEHLQKVIDRHEKDKQSMMQDFLIIMANTPNTFENIMKMPLFTYRLMLKEICINRMMQDENWKIVYLSEKAKKYMEQERNSGNEAKANDSSPVEGADTDALDAFFNLEKQKKL